MSLFSSNGKPKAAVFWVHAFRQDEKRQSPSACR